MKAYLAALLITFFSAFSATSQQISKVKLDSLFDNLEKHDLAMASIAISKNGEVVYRRATGFARMDLHDSVKANVDTRFAIGSITKMFTSSMIFQLVDEGKISLNDTLSRYFPSLPNASKITIRNLLNHRSGLPDFTRNTDFDTWKDTPKTHEELLAMIASHPADFEPGAKAGYCNSNYLVLGYIIEKISGRPYKDVVQDRIISKIGLKQTYYGNDAAKNTGESFSYKYENNGWTKDKVVHLDDFGGAGGILSTPTDLLQFINALFDGHVISKAGLDSMKTLVDYFGMGMFTYNFEKHNGFGHNGKTEGFASSLSTYPGDHFSIAYCTNGEVYPKDDILNKVLSVCFNNSSPAINFNALKVADDNLQKFTGHYFSGDKGIEVISTLVDHALKFEARGRSMVLRAIGAGHFMSPESGFFFEFEKEGKQLIIKDVDDIYKLEKQ